LRHPDFNRLACDEGVARIQLAVDPDNHVIPLTAIDEVGVLVDFDENLVVAITGVDAVLSVIRR
jgi:hypothetical protein